MDLKDRVALVTGGAHRVGKASAIALAAEGAHIALHYGQSHDLARQTADEIAALGVECLVYSADLGNPDDIPALFNTIRARFGRLDVLVNSAASFQKQALEEITVADWDRVLAVNLRAPFLCLQHAAHLMKQTERDQPALVVNLIDLSGVHAWPGYVQHGVSKAGLLHLTRIAARELAPAMRVNALLLGPIIPTQKSGPDEGWQRLIESLPLRRAGGGEAVGEAVVYLARSDFMTGATIALDGGESLIGQIKSASSASNGTLPSAV